MEHKFHPNKIFEWPENWRPGDVFTFEPGVYPGTYYSEVGRSMTQSNFKIGDRVKRKTNNDVGTVVACPDGKEDWGQNGMWILFDDHTNLNRSRGPYWTDRDTSSWEHYVEKENDMGNVESTVLDLIKGGATPDQIRDAIAKAAADYDIYQRGFEDGKDSVTQFEAATFTSYLDGSYRQFRVLGIKEAGNNSDHDALLVVEELLKDDEYHKNPKPKTYGIRLTNGGGHWNSRFSAIR